MRYSPVLGPWTFGGGPGQGVHRRTNEWQTRNAIDMMAKSGTRIVAPEDLKIISVQPSRGTPGTYGWQVHGVGKSGGHFFTHMNRLAGRVRVGNRIKAGQRLGRLGPFPGNRPHLHYAHSWKNPTEIANWPKRPPYPIWRLKSRTGFTPWNRWRKGTHAWKKYGPKNMKVRPNVPRRVPKGWWVRLKGKPGGPF